MIDTDQAGGGNPRYLLRAYVQSGPVRTAVVIGDDDAATRIDLCVRWARAWPRHATMTGKRRISHRLTQSLSLMVAAGIVERDGDTVRVVDRAKLDMVRRNAGVVMDDAGVALPPSQWLRRPEAPPELMAVQEYLESRPSQAEPAETAVGGDISLWAACDEDACPLRHDVDPRGIRRHELPSDHPGVARLRTVYASRVAPDA